ncbi:MAG: DUF4342 domain-containing protein [Dehalococcoidia bacterium]
MGSTKQWQVSGNQLVDRVKALVHEGNIRRVRIIREDKALLDIPLTLGAPAAAAAILAAPVLAALGAFAALVSECTIEVEKTDKEEDKG